MWVTYQPESGDQQEWEFDADRVRAAEAELIEKRYGETWEMWKAGIQQGSIRARRVLLWHLMRRQHHTLRYEDTPDFYTGEVVVEYNTTELGAMRDAVLQISDPDKAEERAAILGAIDVQMTDAMAREATTDAEGDAEPVGKVR